MALTPFQRAIKLADERGISLARAAILLEETQKDQETYGNDVEAITKAQQDRGLITDIPDYSKVKPARPEDQAHIDTPTELGLRPKPEPEPEVATKQGFTTPVSDLMADWGKTALSGVASIPGSVLSGAAEGSDAVTRSLRRLSEKAGVEGAFDILMAPAEMLGITKRARAAGDKLSAGAEAINVEQSKQDRPDIIVANALGQLTGQVAISLVGGNAAGSVAYLGQSFDQIADAVREKGGEGTVGGDVATIAAAPVMASLEKLGIDKIIMRAAPAVRNRVLRGFMDIAAAGGIEAAEEVGEQFVQNFAVKMGVDPKQDLTEGFGQSAIGGGGAGAIARLAARAVGARAGRAPLEVPDVLPATDVANAFSPSQARGDIVGKPRLTPQDRASPLADADIAAGKDVIAKAVGEEDDSPVIVRAPRATVLPRRAKREERAVAPVVEDGRNARQVLKAKIRGVESSGNDAAQNTRSSASGRYQFIDKTFRGLYKRVYGQDLTDAQMATVKNNPQVQERLMDALVADNEAALRRAGQSPTAGNLYLAHFLGSAGAVKALTNPDAPVAASVVKANPNLKGMTNGQVAAWATKKMGGKVSAVATAEDDTTIDYEDADYEAKVAARQAREDAAMAVSFKAIEDAGAAPTATAAKAQEVRDNLDEAKANNPVRQKLAQEAEAKATAGPQPGETPVFESAEEGARQIGWESPTGQFRRIEMGSAPSTQPGAAVGQSEVTTPSTEATASAPPIATSSAIPTGSTVPVATGSEGDFGQLSRPESGPTPVATESSVPPAGNRFELDPTETQPTETPTERPMNTGPGPATVQSSMQGVIAAQSEPTPNLPAIEAAVGADPEVARYDSGEIKYGNLSPVAKQLVDARTNERNFAAVAADEPSITRSDFEQRRIDGMAFTKTFLKDGGLDNAPVPAPTKQQALKSKMATKRAVKKAVAPTAKTTDTVAAPDAIPLPTEVATAEQSPPAPAVANPQEKLRQKTIEKAKDRIDKQVERIDETLTNHGYENEKGPLRATLKRLVKQGVLEQADVDAVAPMFKDKDMDAEDIVSEISGAVQDWGDREKTRLDASAPHARRVKARLEEKANAERQEPQPAPDPEPAREAGRDAVVEDGRVGPDDRPASTSSRGRDEGADRTSGVGETPPVDADGMVTLDHFSLEANLTETDPEAWGRSSKFLPDEERRRIGVAPGRTYFGVGTDLPGGYVNEFKDGVHPRFRTPIHRVVAKLPLARLYDMNGDPDGLKEVGRATPKDENGKYIYNGKAVDGVSLYELLIRDAGYAGYWIKRLGMVAAVFEPVPVQPTEAAPVVKASLLDTPNQKRRAEVWAKVEAAKAEVLAVVRQMGAEGRVNVRVAADLSDVATKGENVSSLTVGYYDPWQRMIVVSAMQNVDSAQVARHEMIHWMRDNGVLNRSEWSALSKWAKSQKSLNKWVDKNYTGLSQDERTEEMVAEGVANVLTKRANDLTNPPGLAKAALRKIAEFVQRIAAAFKKGGLTAADINAAMEIMARIESGEQMEIADARDRGQADRTARLRRDLMNGYLTPQEHYALMSNPAIKYQRAWHGTPREHLDKFSLDFIGTGEGAAAFGWGLYFAEAKAIATFYRNKLTKTLLRPDEAVLVNGVPLGQHFSPDGIKDSWGGYDVASHIADFLSSNQPYNGWLSGVANKALNEYDKAIADTRAEIEEIGDEGGEAALRKASAQEELANLERGLTTAEAMFNDMISSKATITMRGVNGESKPGALLGVDIPEADELLDLDVPLAEQPAPVKKALEKLRSKLSEDTLDTYEENLNADFWEWTGLDLQQRVLPRMQYDDTFPEDIDLATLEALENGETKKAASLYLRSLGIVGNRYFDSNSRGQKGGDLTRNFVIFDDTRINIRVKERRISPLNEPDPNPTLLGNLRDVAIGLVTAMRVRGDVAGAAFDQWRTTLQDKMLPLLRVQHRIEAALGRRLTDDENAYTKETLYSSRVGDQLERLSDGLVEPLLIDLHASGISVEELDEYLYARHAPERNAQISAINPNFGPDEGSGMTNAEASQIMADVAASGKQAEFDALAARVDALVEFSIQTRVDGGLLSVADATILRNNYQNYVPLRGHEELDPGHEGSAARTGRGINITGSETRRAFGRDSKANDILGHVILQAEEAIVRAEKNQVAVAFANMVREFPEDGFWQTNPVAQVRTYNSRTGMVETTSRPPTSTEKERTVSYKVDGVESRILLDPDGNNATAARLAKSMRNIGPQQMGQFTSMVATVGRYLSMINTSYNPEFVISNALRDLQTASLNLTQHEIGGLVSGVLKDWASMKPLLAAHRAERGRLGHAVWDGWADAFSAAGGKVHFNQMDNIDALRTRLKKELVRKGQSKWNGKRWLRNTKEMIENANGAVENAIRLATFKNAVESGMTHQQAAEVAKNVTVNFNRHGQLGPALNAYYVFANASIQGSTIMLQALARSKRVRRAAFAATILGFALDMLNRWLDDDDDDGQSLYSKIPEFTKQRNLILMAPWLGKGKFVQLPMTWGYNVFPTVGRLVSEAANGARSIPSAMGATMSAMIDAFNPIGGTNSLLNFVAPTLLDPVVDITQNKDFAGRPISPEQPINPKDQVPDSQLSWPQTSNFFKTPAEMLNALGGGDEVTPARGLRGWMDVSPETLEYVSAQVVGAAGQFAGRVAQLASAPFTDRELTANDIPMKRKVIGDVPTWRDQSNYYSRMRAAEYAVDRLARYRELGDKDGEAELMAEDGDLTKMGAATKAARKAQTELNKEKRAIAKAEKLGKIDSDQASAAMATIKTKQEDLVLRYNTAWVKVIGDKREIPED